MRIVALLAVVMTIGTGVAAACPPGPCNKYRRMPMPVMEAEVAVYRRASPMPAPGRFDRRGLEWLLTNSPWIPISLQPMPGPTTAARTVRFVSPTRVQRTAPTADRMVLVRQLERRGRTIYVEIDGVFFAIESCRDGRALSTCLRRVGALPDDASVNPQRFATPP